ncbi:hypothetical protein RchiOBHm_Chr5g0009241 [Rosa chinensis]|uniref:Uncharacterized protein n=1 Tax=Rosa chinensis TaxID=74649 RepID=A0A2P6Q4A9_ROSCH|nr:hypothetical protein RchiOBHm_Chr5g0009241 [Rosa chinensis]
MFWVFFYCERLFSFVYLWSFLDSMQKSVFVILVPLFFCILLTVILTLCPSTDVAN